MRNTAVALPQALFTGSIFCFSGFFLCFLFFALTAAMAPAASSGRPGPAPTASPGRPGLAPAGRDRSDCFWVNGGLATRLKTWKNQVTPECPGEIYLTNYYPAFDPAFIARSGASFWGECLGADTGGMAEIERYRNRALHDRTYRTGRHYNEFFMRYCQSIPDRFQINETLAWNRIWRELDRGGVVVFY